MSAAALCAGRRDVLAAVLARLIPADEQGPGALEVGVLDCVVRALREEHAEHRDAYARGLDALASAAQRRHGEAFGLLRAVQQDALLAQMEQDADGSGFFELVRGHAIEGFFGDPSAAAPGGWKLLGYPGPKREWSEREQQLDAEPTAPAP